MYDKKVFLRCLWVGFLILSFSFSPLAQTLEDKLTHINYWIQTLQTHSLQLMRKNAARALGKMGDPRAFSPLVLALKDPYPDVRAEAARALGLLGDNQALPALNQAMQSETDSNVRRNTYFAIENIKTHEEFLKKKKEKLEAEREKQSLR